MNPQPNFEALKTAFYRAYVDSDTTNNAVLMQSLCGKLLQSFTNRKDTFKKDFNKWLDGIDIRQAGELILIMKEHGKSLPKWMTSWKYNIDYNDKGFLDLIRMDD